MRMQDLQPYESYQIVRYLDSLKPGANFGGWVDPFGSGTIDRYAEQLWLTLFAKAPEITLFDFGQMLRQIRSSERGVGFRDAFDNRGGCYGYS